MRKTRQNSYCVFISFLWFIYSAYSLEDKSYEIKETIQNIMLIESPITVAYDELINNYFSQNFQTKSYKEATSFKNPEKDQEAIKTNTYDIENYETINYESAINFNKDPKYSWLFCSSISNITMKNRNILLDHSGKEYIQLDLLVMDFGERQLFIPSSKNNSFKSFSKSYSIEIIKTISFSENVKIHLTNNTSDLSQEGFNYSFPISIIPDKIGEISSMILVYFKIKRKDGSSKSFEKIVPIEIKAKIIESKYELKEMEKVYISLEEIWNFSFNIYNPTNKNIVIRECSTNKNNLKIDLGLNDPKSDNLNERKKLVIKSKEYKSIGLIFTPSSLGTFDCTANIKTDEDFFMIVIKIFVINSGVNFVKEFLDFGIIYNKWIMHQIPLKVFNIAPRNYEIIDIIISSKDNSGLTIFYEENTRYIPSSVKDKTLGYLKIFPSDFEKNGYIEGNIYLILNDTNWTPDDHDREYFSLKVGFAGAYFEKILAYDQLEFSAFIGNNSNRKAITSSLDIKSNFYFPMKFKGFSFNNSLIAIHNFSSNNVLYSNKPSMNILNVTFENYSIAKKTIIFLNYLGFNIPIPFFTYDGKLEVIYHLNKKGWDKLIEKCDGICKSIQMDFGVFSNEEKRILKLQLKNPNPITLIVSLLNINTTNGFLELNSYYDENKQNHILNKQLQKNDQFELCSLCLAEISVMIRNEKPTKEIFFIEFLTNHSKNFDFFRIFAIYETINGSLLIPSSSNIRFQPGFPGIVQSRLVSIKSSFEIDCRVLEVESVDPRIIPYILKDVIAANSKEEFIKVVFDPSFFQKDNKAGLTEKLPSLLTYEDFFFWKEYKQYWENIGPSDFKASVIIKFDLVENVTLNVKGYLKYPSLTNDETIDFGIREINTITRRNITIFNPSDKVMSVQLFLGLDDENLINFYVENYFVLLNKKISDSNQTFLCNNYDFENKKKNNSNFKSYEEYISKKPNENNNLNGYNNEIEENLEKNRLKSQIYSLINNHKLNFENDQLRDYCNYTMKRDILWKGEGLNKEIPEIKTFTEKEVLETESFLNNLTLMDKINKYLNSWITPCPEKKNYFESLNENQTYFLDKKYVHKVFHIMPHSNLTLPAVIFKPNKYRSISSFLLLIKNNLTHIHPVKLKGIGGKSEISIIEARILFQKDGIRYFNSQKVSKENDKTFLKFVIHKDEFPNFDLFSNFPYYLENSQLPNEIIRYFKIRNLGNLPVKFERISIEQNGCKGFGFEIRNCHPFSLSPNSNHILEISFSLDYTQKQAQKNLYLITKKEIIHFYLQVDLPFLAVSTPKIKYESNYYEFKMIEGVSFVTIILFVISLIKSLKYKSYIKKKNRGEWKLIEASDIFELRDQNSVFSFENDIYELRKLRQAVKQTSNYTHSLLFEASQSFDNQNLLDICENEKKNYENRIAGQEQGNQGNQEFEFLGKEAGDEGKEEKKSERNSKNRKEEKTKKGKNQDKKKNVKKETNVKAKKSKKEEVSVTKDKKEEVSLTKKDENIDKTKNIEQEVIDTEIAKDNQCNENNEIPSGIVDSTKEVSPKLSEAPEEKSASISEIQVMESFPLKDKEVSDSFKPSEIKKEDEEKKIGLEEDPQDSTLKLIENAEVILNTDKIDSSNIGIIGGKKKKKANEEPQQAPQIPNDEVSSNQDVDNPGSSLLKEKSKQYYDPFSKLPGPNRNENIWHYSLFPSTGTKKNNPPGLSLFTTNRENKYSMFSNNFYYKNQEEDENEEENEKHQTSYDEKSDSEFSEKSFLQNKLNSGKCPSELIEQKDIATSEIINKGEQDVTSRYFRTFNFPQGNNPFSLAQLLNPKPAEENLNIKPNPIEKEKALNWNSTAFTGNLENLINTGNTAKSPNFYFNFNEGTNEEFNQNVGTIAFKQNISSSSNLSSDNISRKPPPGFKPNK